MSNEHVNEAVEAYRRFLAKWGTLSTGERAEVFSRVSAGPPFPVVSGVPVQCQPDHRICNMTYDGAGGRSGRSIRTLHPESAYGLTGAAPLGAFGVNGRTPALPEDYSVWVKEFLASSPGFQSPTYSYEPRPPETLEAAGCFCTLASIRGKPWPWNASYRTCTFAHPLLSPHDTSQPNLGSWAGLAHQGNCSFVGPLPPKRKATRWGAPPSCGCSSSGTRPTTTTGPSGRTCHLIMLSFP